MYLNRKLPTTIQYNSKLKSNKKYDKKINLKKEFFFNKNFKNQAVVLTLIYKITKNSIKN